MFSWRKIDRSGNGGNPRDVARSLLGTRLPFIDTTKSFSERRFDEHHPAVFGSYPLSQLIERKECIPAILHDAFEADGELRTRFTALRQALVRLARTGVAEEQALGAGERMLPDLIDHLRSKENLFKSAVNPEVADAAAAVERILPELLRAAFSQETPPHAARLERKLETEATPNEIDRQQIAALKHYDYCRLGRLALEKLAEGVHEINALLDQKRQR